jgi:hypothetical protein
MPTTIPESLKRLFEHAGRAEAERQERERRSAEKRRREIVLDSGGSGKPEPSLQPPASGPGPGWSWLEGLPADELRESLRKFVMIIGWNDDRGAGLR